MTAIVLYVDEGPATGEEFRFEESDDVIVGSDRPGCEAHLRLPGDDRSVSRHHCVLEFRPPNCQIRDLGSKNGTQVRPSGEQEWQPIETADLSDGDAIRVGQTVLSIELITESDDAVSEPVRCIRCMNPIAPILASGSFSYGAVDFMCETCRAGIVAAAEPVDADEPSVRCAGAGCGKDLTTMADRDGRAGEVDGLAFYLCEECAELRRELMRSSIGGWMLLSQLGRGGMGVVYLVWHPETGRVAALKHLLKPLGLPPAKHLRFQREIALLQSLRHPQVTRLFEAGEDDGVPFFVSEFVPDGDLSQFVSTDGEPTLTPLAATRLIADTLEGLAYIHDAGIVHRDMKPANVLVARDNGSLIPKVADFGLSRSYERHGGTITQRGEVGGTMAYLAPEQVTNFKRSRPPVDVYSTGVCLSPALAVVVDAAVQRDPDRRIQTATEFRERLLGTLAVRS